MLAFFVLPLSPTLSAIVDVEFPSIFLQWRPPAKTSSAQEPQSNWGEKQTVIQTPAAAKSQAPALARLRLPSQKHSCHLLVKLGLPALATQPKSTLATFCAKASLLRLRSITPPLPIRFRPATVRPPAASAQRETPVRPAEKPRPPLSLFSNLSEKPGGRERERERERDAFGKDAQSNLVEQVTFYHEANASGQSALLKDAHVTQQSLRISAHCWCYARHHRARGPTQRSGVPGLSTSIQPR